MITLDDLKDICHYAKYRTLDPFVEPLNKTMEEFEIDTPKRQAAFLAQIAHESGEFRYVREIASGEDYEGREDLGNTEPGDGRRFKGRGLLQCTGRDCYRACGLALGVDFLSEPELLETYQYASRSAGWVWRDFKKLNPIADKGDFKRITKLINGGMNGYSSRVMYWERAKKTLGAA